MGYCASTIPLCVGVGLRSLIMTRSGDLFVSLFYVKSDHSSSRLNAHSVFPLFPEIRKSTPFFVVKIFSKM